MRVCCVCSVHRYFIIYNLFYNSLFGQNYKYFHPQFRHTRKFSQLHAHDDLIKFSSNIFAYSIVSDKFDLNKCF